MLKHVWSLLDSVKFGRRLKTAIQRILQRAAVVSIAAGVLIGAVNFGLVTVYQALVSVHGFTPVESAGIIAAALALIGLLALAALPLVGKEPKEEIVEALPNAEEAVALVNQGVGGVAERVGPLTLVTIAFAAGVLASRR